MISPRGGIILSTAQGQAYQMPSTQLGTLLTGLSVLLAVGPSWVT
jgi:hypothetical protein